MADFTVTNHGTICTLRMNTDAAREWVKENVAEPYTNFGRAIGVQPRCMPHLLEGIQEYGLTVEIE